MAQTRETASLESQIVPAHVDPSRPVGAAAPKPATQPPEPAAAPVHDADDLHEKPARKASDPRRAAPAAQPAGRGGFFPALLGGAIAAAGGFGISEYLNRGNSFDPAPLRAEIAALQDQIDALPAVPDLSGVERTLAEAQDDTTTALNVLRGQLDSTAATLTGVEERLTRVEMRGDQGAVDRSALEAYERQLSEMRDQMEVQTARLTEAAAAATQRLEQVDEEAQASRAAAEETRRLAAARSALGTVETALAQGGPYADALPALAEVADLPEALTAPAGDGVATLSALQADLPAASRAALAASRSAGDSGEDGGGRVGAFLRSQFQVRSTTAQDGTSANAVLSRIEAAVRQGDLDTALTEYAALPPSAQEPMSDWAAQVRTRLGATEAARTLSQTLTEK